MSWSFTFSSSTPLLIIEGVFSVLSAGDFFASDIIKMVLFALLLAEPRFLRGRYLSGVIDCFLDLAFFVMTGI